MEKYLQRPIFCLSLIGTIQSSSSICVIQGTILYLEVYGILFCQIRLLIVSFHHTGWTVYKCPFYPNQVGTLLDNAPNFLVGCGIPKEIVLILVLNSDRNVEKTDNSKAIVRIMMKYQFCTPYGYEILCIISVMGNKLYY